MEIEIYRFWYKHNTIAEGLTTSKTHLGTLDGLFCGLSTEARLFSMPLRVDEEWINQPDPDGELCKKCKKIALTKL